MKPFADSNCISTLRIKLNKKTGPTKRSIKIPHMRESEFTMRITRGFISWIWSEAVLCTYIAEQVRSHLLRAAFNELLVQDAKYCHCGDNCIVAIHPTVDKFNEGLKDQFVIKI